MARLPFHKRRTKLDTVKDLAQIYTTLKLTQVGPRAARRAAKGYAGVKAAKAGGRGARRVVGIALAPIAIGGLVAFLKKRNQEPPYQPVPSPMPEASEPRFDTTPAMGEPAAPKSGTSSASPQEPADADADAPADATADDASDATADAPAGDAAKRS
jgi:hypothetical protein